MESVPTKCAAGCSGLFITISGLLSNLSHWLVGRWVEQLGPQAYSVRVTIALHRAGDSRRRIGWGMRF